MQTAGQQPCVRITAKWIQIHKPTKVIVQAIGGGERQKGAKRAYTEVRADGGYSHARACLYECMYVHTKGGKSDAKKEGVVKKR